MATVATTNEPRVNERIRIREVRLIDKDGRQVGVVPTDRAMAMAREAGLDLVEVAPDSRPPVAKIMDYGKFKYERKKQIQESRKKSHAVQIKEVRLRPKTGQHDFDVKLGRARGFLEDGDKVQVNMMFRGRELAHLDIGRGVVERFSRALEDIARMERPPIFEGRRMTCLLTRK
ncbi:MAG: translation initiation factor IF-3 [Planctomycetaceae bacterium]|nr:translation initiation factor IF-3 [Planctomycetota bacterium]NUN52113.1 translation initiation factor IF-3 [Planctomycetaceae bacterium]